MENLENNLHNDVRRPASDQDASSSKTNRLMKSGDFVQSEEREPQLGNPNQAGMDEGDMLKQVPHRPDHPIPEANASKKIDVDLNSETVAKCNRNKPSAGNNKGSQDGTPDNQRDQGMVDSLVGATYQQKLLFVILCHVAKLIREDGKFDFEITSEDTRGGKFDDIGVRFKQGDRWKDLFFQAKHKEDKRKAITWDDLTSTDKRASFAIIHL
ncbi:hypothetical protein ZHAS_00003660 [Anopheles sinensis]|uniref:Uncharacterized protein n=1 Tax=Anopheles sinensis TaxID=74873 RepID=A0A084VEX2_ANOSI|nr:hypothetical protein ZHAS_00003660 [Anopheles sinensis]